jgi:Zn-dependent protease with chaperone function
MDTFIFSESEISEREKEEASNAYLMGLMTGFVGLPLPIINLIACVLYFFLNKSKSRFGRFHIFQMVSSQLFLIALNSYALGWLIQIVFYGEKLSGYFWAYILTVLIFNISDFIANIIAAIEVRKGKLYSFLFFGSLAKFIYYRNFLQKVSVKKVVSQFAIISLIFIAVAYLIYGVFSFSKSIDISFSEKNEMLLGDKFIELMLRDEQEIKNSRIDSVLNIIQGRLTGSIKSSAYKYKLHVIKNEQVNAFAFPGAHIVIYSGLLKESSSAEELASVLAHEIAHVERHHVMKHFIKNFSIAVFSGIIFSGDASVLGGLAQEFISNMFSRDQELEADHYALQLLESSNIDPRYFSRFLEKLNSKQQHGKEYSDFFSTHPSTEKRIKTVNLYQVKKDFRAINFQIDWDVFKESTGIVLGETNKDKL